MDLEKNDATAGCRGSSCVVYIVLASEPLFIINVIKTKMFEVFQFFFVASFPYIV